MKKYSYFYILWAIVFILLPLVLIFVYSFNGEIGVGFEEYSFSLDNYKNFFDSLYIKILLVSIGLAMISTLLCLLIGYPLAYIISRMSERLRNNLILLFVIPMWMNFLLRTYAWLTLLGNNGLLNKFFGLIGLGPFDLMYNMKAVLLGMVYNFLPFMVLPIYSVLLKIDKDLIDAAKDLGADNKKVFLKVILPLSLPGVYTGITMVFIPAISTFVIPNLLGGNKFYLIGNLIERQFTFTGDWGFGSAISIILIIIMFLSLFVTGTISKGKSENQEGGGLW
ncbi:ABC transporter permease [Peptoniphilus catoniae]|uniref:ABC transporter permease n=1 Tax=Peptoniphilus catoniae TaxID=1660341 RepID=UPI0010FD2A51|nr:ABC transporter permease [Peptoniphilus catoniae]